MTRRWGLQLAAILAAGSVVLTGCASKQEASQTLPTTSAAKSTAALPPLGPKDMPMPAEARTKDAAGAQAFVRYYIKLLNRTSTVMDAKPLRDFSDGCRDCDRIATSTEKAASLGKNYRGGEMTITEMGRPVMRENAASVPIVVDQAKFIVLDPSGAPTSGGSDAFTAVTGGVGLSWDTSRRTWLMTDLTFG